MGKEDVIALPNRVINLNNGYVIHLSKSDNKLCKEPKYIIETYRDKNDYKCHRPENLFYMNLSEASDFIQRELFYHNF